eukprot:TRINITY_DN544_c0_g1::TRINITY_DN544_c0_g1_i1::g.10492::m.10492 TRINITY_DN544_c0_g1::TRINITY_DN544_c0_g1_i1::g.10492  ORF type:complete len:323 (+),score=45.90,sp/Q9R062/GLYG_MOUSE/28.30/4e-17,Glyco_transf_8/PF01501.15/6.7e-29 TRINITY_DN544_c0_g1_i1:115-1083(+)
MFHLFRLNLYILLAGTIVMFFLFNIMTGSLSFGGEFATVADPLSQRSCAFVTFVDDDKFVDGARVLAYSLIAFRTPHDLICLAGESVSDEKLESLDEIFDDVIVVDDIHLPENAMSRTPDRVQSSFKRLHAWELTEYERIVLIDPDVLPLSSLDELCEMPLATCAATREVGFNFSLSTIQEQTSQSERKRLQYFREHGIFNAGVMAFRTNPMDYANLMHLIETTSASFVAAEQIPLNYYYQDKCQRLPDSYNVILPYIGAEPDSEFYGDYPSSQYHLVHFSRCSKPLADAFDENTCRVIKTTDTQNVKLLGREEIWLEYSDT